MLLRPLHRGQILHEEDAPLRSIYHCQWQSQI
jgi:hypothetical protein